MTRKKTALITAAAVHTPRAPIHRTALNVPAKQVTPEMDIPAKVRINEYSYRYRLLQTTVSYVT